MSNIKRFGVDIATWQKSVDWAKLKPKVDFVLIRTGYGKNASQKDNMFDSHIKGAESQGIPYGFYHYSYADTPERAKLEAAFCLSIIKQYSPDYPVAIDVEDNSVANVPKAQLTDAVLAFCEEIQKAGYKPAVYASLSWMTGKLDMSRIEPVADVWVAQYYKECQYKGRVDMWQYSSDGVVDGIAGRVDVNWCYKDYLPPVLPPVEVEPKLVLDNTPDGYAEASVRKAVERDILRGNDKGDFMLHSPVTRQDLFVILDRAGLL